MHTELNPTCPLHAPPNHITFTVDFDKEKVHVLDCDMDEDCNCE